MAGLRPIGSEKLEGVDKISRIMEIARYNEVKPTPINEDKKTVYSKTLADGNTYIISKEKVGYVIKKSLTESVEDADYIEPMKNRKHYSSYSQAFKRLNLIVKEVNVNEGQTENISLFEQSSKKYTLKTPKPSPVEEPAMDELPDMDSEELDMDMGGEELDMDLDMDMGDEESDMEMDMGMEMDDEESDDEDVSFKSIQKLTGKLGQKIRSFLDSGDQMSSKDVKYVINSVLSALDLSALNEDDKEDVLEKFEDYESEDEMEFDDNEEEMGLEDEMEMDFEDSMGDMEGGETSEGYHNEEDDMETKINKKVGDMFETIFSESKVDSVLEKYFVINESEKKAENSKKSKTKQARKLSESISQEVASIKFLKENPNAKLIGKTNRGNLVFENDNTKYRISSKGMVI
jgi:hypothetical protein